MRSFVSDERIFVSHERISVSDERISVSHASIFVSHERISVPFRKLADTNNAHGLLNRGHLVCISLLALCTCSYGRSLFFGPPPAARLRETRFTPRHGTVSAGTFWNSASIC